MTPADHPGRPGRRVLLALLLCQCTAPALWIGGVLPMCTVLSLVWTALTLLLLAALGPAPEGLRRCAALLAALAAPVALMTAQLVPLPPSWLLALSPRAAALHALAALPGAAPLTLDVPATVMQLGHGALLLGVALAAAWLCRDRRRARRLLWALSVCGGIEAAVAALHLLCGNRTSVLWIYPFPPGWVSGLGTFINCNHAASLLLLTSGVTAGLVLERAPSTGLGRGALWLLLAAQVAALVWSRSRGAVGAGVLFAVVLMSLCWQRRMGAARALLLSGLGALALALVAAQSVPWVSHRLRPLWDGSIWRYQKVRVWRDTPALIRDFPLAGAGRGAFRSAFAAYRTGDEYVLETSPASLPLQHAAELGVPAAILLWLLGARVARDLWRRKAELDPAELGAACGCGAVLLHNLVEFSLEYPGVAVPWVACLSLVCARAHRREPPSRQQAGATSPRVPARALAAALGLALVAVAAATGWAQPRRLEAQHERLRQALLRRDPATEDLYQAAVRWHPADAPIALLGASTAVYVSHQPLLALRRTNRVLQLHPADSEVHWVAAHALRDLGKPAQALLEVRLGWDRSFRWNEARLKATEALVGPDALLDAVRQEPDVMDSLATYLEAAGRPGQAARARRRQALLNPHHEPIR